MHGILLYIKKNILKKYYTYFLIFIALAILLSCLITVFASGQALSQAYRNALKSTYGTQQYVAFHVSTDEIPENIFSSVGVTKIFGTLQKEQKTAAIGWMDETALKMHEISLISGRFAQKENEIVLEEWVKERFFPEAEIGESIKLSYNAFSQNGMFDFPKEKTLILSGIIKNYSSVQTGDVLTPEAGYEQLPSVLFCSLPQDTDCYVETLSCIFIENAFNGRPLLQQYFQPAEISSNDEYYRADISNIDTFIVQIFKLIVLAATVLILPTILFLFVWGDFPSLKKAFVLGADKNQLFIVVFLKCIIEISASLILGTLLSFFTVGAFSRLLLTFFSIDIASHISQSALMIGISLYLLVGLLSSAVISLLSVRLLTREPKTAKKKHIIFSSKNPFILFAYKNILTHFSKFMATSFCLAVCITVFCCSFAVSKGFIKDLEHPFCDFSLEFNMQIFAGPLRIPCQEKRGFTEKELEPIINDINIKNLFLTKYAVVNILSEDTEIHQLFADRLLRPFSSNPEEMEQEKSRYGYKTTENLYRTTIKGVDEPVLDILKNFKTIGQINKEQLKKGEEVILCVSEQKYDDKIKALLGKDLVFTQIFDYIPEKSEGFRRDMTAEVAGIVIVPEKEDLYTRAFASNGYDFLWNSSAFLEYGIHEYYFGVYIETINDTDVNHLNSVLAEIKEENPEATYISKTEIKQAEQKINNIVVITSSAIISILGLLAFLIIFLNYLLSVNQKKELLKTLYSIGMTRGELNQLILTEHLLYLLTGYFLSLPFIILFTFVLEAIVFLPMIILRSLIVLAVLSAFSALLSIYNYLWIKKNILEPA